MKLTRNKDVTPKTTDAGQINYSEVADSEEKEKSKFRLSKRTSEPTTSIPSSDEKVEEKIEVNVGEKSTEWNTTDKILPKLVNKSPKASFGSAVEFSKAAFGLTKRNDNGYRESLDGKLLMNFWTFDQTTNKQLHLIPAYIDISEWLNVSHMILSGRLHDKTAEAREKQISGGYKYCNYIYQNNGGSYKQIFKLNGKQFGGDAKHPIATLFKITPAGDSKTKDKWTLSAEILKGCTGNTGLIEPLKNEKPLAKITVLVTYDDLVKIARMSELAIQTHMFKI